MYIAGVVTYDAKTFLAKNADSAHPDTVDLFSSSDIGLVQDLFAEESLANANRQTGFL